MFKNNHYYSDGTKVQSFGMFIVPIAMTIVVGFPLLTKYPLPIVILLVSLCTTFVLISLNQVYCMFIIERYIQKNDFQLWKKSKSCSLKDRKEAAKMINEKSSQIPCLEKHVKYSNKFAFVLLLIWTVLFIGVFLFIMFSALSGLL